MPRPHERAPDARADARAVAREHRDRAKAELEGVRFVVGRAAAKGFVVVGIRGAGGGTYTAVERGARVDDEATRRAHDRGVVEEPAHRGVVLGVPEGISNVANARSCANARRARSEATAADASVDAAASANDPPMKSFESCAVTAVQSDQNARTSAAYEYAECADAAHVAPAAHDDASIAKARARECEGEARALPRRGFRRDVPGVPI